MHLLKCSRYIYVQIQLFTCICCSTHATQHQTHVTILQSSLSSARSMSFSPCCMECRRGLAMRICLSVRPSVKRVHCDKLRLTKVCYKVYLCENCQRRSCKAFIDLTIRAKMICGGDPFYLKFFFWVKLAALEQNRRFSIYFRS